MYTTRTKLQILGDYVSNFRKVETKDYYLFTMNVVQEEFQDEKGDSWEGSIQRMRKFNQKMFERLESKFDDKISRL